jgi:hypothetical protein
MNRSSSSAAVLLSAASAMAQEDPAAVGRVGVADEIGRRGRRDLHARHRSAYRDQAAR